MTESMSLNHKEEPVRLLVLGGSYGGMAAALNFADLCAEKSSRFTLANVRPGHKIPVDITIVDERDGYCTHKYPFFHESLYSHPIDHLIGSPLALADEQYGAKAWVKFAEIKALQHPQFRIKHGSVTDVDPEAKVAQIRLHGSLQTEDLEYDYLIAATGLRRAWPSVPQALTRKSYLDEIRPHIASVSKAEHGVAVIGGGEPTISLLS